MTLLSTKEKKMPENGTVDINIIDFFGLMTSSLRGPT